MLLGPRFLDVFRESVGNTLVGIEIESHCPIVKERLHISAFDFQRVFNVSCYASSLENLNVNHFRLSICALDNLVFCVSLLSLLCDELVYSFVGDFSGILSASPVLD